ncbi:hypothetical protein MKW92_005359 [Papaver armeniacum]|nr:hypothetical protein MKW92_005359 [Papaver armeniacum]
MPPEKSEIFKSLETSGLNSGDEYLVILVGDMITEKRFPTYQTILTTLDVPGPWDARTRAWSGEENRHGDLLSKYLYLSGRPLPRVHLTFQERATFISHGNTARLGKAHGDIKLAQICGTILRDEKRHEIAYTKIIRTFADMIKKKITMPAHLMFDGQDDNLFENYSNVDQRLGVYIAKDLFIGENHFH